MAYDAGYKSGLERYHITLLIVVMAVSFIELPYVIVSRVEYDWLNFSRNVLTGLSLLLGAALWDRCRRREEPAQQPKEE